ncbi:MAG: GNAT family N-acetyltransferase [Saprospiraceae bacterium]
MHITLVSIQPDEDPTKAEYASEDCKAALQMWANYYPKIDFQPPWIGYFVKLDNQIVGCCAFTGPPKQGRVEISYWTFAPFEGKGIATHACRALIELAQKADPSLTIFAKTAPEKNASTTILERCGFVFSGIVQDHEIGDAWEWTLLV